MNGAYIAALAALQLLTGALASAYIIRVLTGGPVTASLALAVLAAFLGFLLGGRNVVKLRKTGGR